MPEREHQPLHFNRIRAAIGKNQLLLVRLEQQRTLQNEINDVGADCRRPVLDVVRGILAEFRDPCREPLIRPRKAFALGNEPLGGEAGDLEIL